MTVEVDWGEKRDRNWEIWRRRSVDRQTFKSIADDMGIGIERTRQIHAKCQREVRNLIRRNSVSMGVNLRDHLLGVEFAFTHEYLVQDCRHKIFKKEYEICYDGNDFGIAFWVPGESDRVGQGIEV